ncbi:MAG: class I SAM-dependent methyltransferase [Parvibaculum sp.]|uniref:class I SAM-dependent methyltransferase n=1 Tax=Parvibaculum sp. TaxID=2024848 RepID=UPI002ABC36DC|nr:class I SAM-dependent methyltransferase [Parvibaculum sp.]MDZ4381134.1 class I SAM-dependent methyltransferase [Parvibaculum sp.]
MTLTEPVTTDATALEPSSCMICGGHAFRPAGVSSGYRIFRCMACGFHFVHPTPPLSEIAAIYEQYSSNTHYSAKAERKVVRAMKQIRRYRRLAHGSRFIDFGCNIGTAVEAAHRLGFEAYGVDIGDESIAIARKEYPSGHYHEGPVESLPADWKDFDLAFMIEVIEHLPDPHAYVEAMKARLKPGALLYLTTPDAGHWSVPKDFTAWREVFPPQHLHYFTKDAMRRFLTGHGFDVIRFVWSPKSRLKVLARKR